MPENIEAPRDYYAYAVSVEYPYSWAQGHTLFYSSESEAKTQAAFWTEKSGPSGTEKYIRVGLYKRLEDDTNPR